MEYIRKGAINSKSFWKNEGVDINWDDGQLPPKISIHRLRKFTRDFLSGLDYCKL